MKFLILIPIFFIITAAACSKSIEDLSNLTPSQCRDYGVNVSDDDIITGIITHSQFGTLGTVYKHCGGAASGCARPTNFDDIFPAPDKKYSIYYAEGKCVPYHEACHALYEESNHTVAFNIRIMQGDSLAACP